MPIKTMCLPRCYQRIQRQPSIQLNPGKRISWSSWKTTRPKRSWCLLKLMKPWRKKLRIFVSPPWPCPESRPLILPGQFPTQRWWKNIQNELGRFVPQECGWGFKKRGFVGSQPLIRTIDKKLTTAPDQYGAPLSHNLKNFRKLRIGDYRVVYRIVEKKVIVFVLAVGPRRDKEIYNTASERI